MCVSYERGWGGSTARGVTIRGALNNNARTYRKERTSDDDATVLNITAAVASAFVILNEKVVHSPYINRRRRRRRVPRDAS